MAFINKVILFLLWSCVTALSAQDSLQSAYSSSLIRRIETDIIQASTIIQSLHIQREILESEADSLGREILGIKQHPTIDIFDRMQLKSRLTQAELLSTAIFTTDRAIFKQQDLIRNKIGELMSLMDDEVRVFLTQIEGGFETRTDTIKIRLYGMLQEKLTFQILTLSVPDIQPERIRFFINDEPEVLKLKSEFMMDQYNKLLNYAMILESAMRLIKNDRELIRRSFLITRDSTFLSIKGHPSRSHRLPLTRQILESDETAELKISKIALEIEEIEKLARHAKVISHEIDKMTLEVSRETD